MRWPNSTGGGRALALLLGALALHPAAASAAGPEGALDARAWEMVSPLEKNGGEVEAPGAILGGAFQAAAGGSALAYASRSSFADAAGAAPVSQYIALRGASAWSTANLTPPLLSGTYEGGAYQLFSEDLSRAILANGWRCRDGAASCAAANPPLAPGAPPGYRNLYRREVAAGTYTPLITTANSPALSLAPEDFHLRLAGATPDLAHVVFSTCAALSAEAIEVPLGAGCDPSARNLYRFSAGALQAINVLPAQTQSAPGATLAAPSGAISSDGGRIYWRGADGNLYLRQGPTSVQVDADAGGEGTFQAASTDGTLAYFTKEGHLHRFEAAGQSITDLTPGAGVEAVLAASADGSHVYYLGASGLLLWHAGATTTVSAAANLANVVLGAARVSAEGGRLAFVSSASLTGYANVGKTEVFLYSAPSKSLLCVSCSPFGKTPLGPSSIPAARGAGGAPPAHEPRALSADGNRLFFDSVDRLVSADTNKAPDVYQWQAQGTGGCAKAGGCVGLLSSGRIGSAAFLDASAEGTDAFFLTGVSLLPADPGALDVYDARAGGGFPEAAPPPPCEGDDCQGPPPGPDDPTPPTATLQGPVNPPVRFKDKRKPKCAKRATPRQRKRCQRGNKGQRSKGQKRSNAAKGRGGRR